MKRRELVRPLGGAATGWSLAARGHTPNPFAGHVPIRGKTAREFILPIGLSLAPKFWPDFPYATIGRYYDVVLPMSYSTYRVSGATATYDYTMGNIAFLRSVLGPTVSLHVIGGNASQSGRLETRAFVQACNDARVTGASMWHYTAYGDEDWQEMRALDL